MSDSHSALARTTGTVVLRTLALVLACCTSPAQSAEETGAETDRPIFLFTSFEEPAGDGLRFLYSEDGYRWERIPGTFLKPWVGNGKLMRDPSLLRDPDGRFHLVWTTAWRGDPGFGYAFSTDLVHWSQQQFIPVMAHEPTCVNVWAPELFYDAARNRFIICWASTIPGRYPDHLEERTNNHRMYYTTTHDFQTFAPTQLFLEPGFSVIDGCIVQDGDRYWLVLKDNTRPQRNLRVAQGDSPTGPWRQISEPLTEKFTEGPTVAKIDDRWVIYFDAYRAKVYGALATQDFEHFTEVTGQMTFPKDHKHGTVVRITRKELEYLQRVGSEQVPGLRLPAAASMAQERLQDRLQAIDRVARQGPFQPDWNSIQNFRTPDWYQDAKFGIFIHWGAYSVPAFSSEWYPRNMYQQGSKEHQHHIATYGPLTEVGYKDLIQRFEAKQFDAGKWAQLFHAAGAKYVIPVAEHHDGFPMYASDYTRWSAAKMGPRCDVLGELATAIRGQGLVFGASSHRAEHWWFFDQGMLVESDVQNPHNADLYGPASNKRVAESQAEPPDQAFLDDWLLRTCEIVDKYQPEIIYFDWWICQPVFQPYLKTFAAYYYNRAAEWDKRVAINFKQWEGRSFPDGTGVFDIERGQAAAIRPEFWQTDTSVSKNSWGYIAHHDYKNVNEIIDDLVDIVSKNGTLLLNIGPKPDGTIPEMEQKMLLEIGRWLEINGDAIYGTRPWKIFGEGPTQVIAGSFGDVKRAPFTGQDFRFTTKQDTLFAIGLAWPDKNRLVVQSLAEDRTGPIDSVSLLGHSGPLDWQQTAAGLVVTLPATRPCDHAFVLEIKGLLEP